MIEATEIRFAGDVAIDNITVITSKGLKQNITNQVLAIEIYEDLFSPFITGKLTVNDSFDFVNLFPFIGEEYLDVKIYTPTFDKKDYIEQQFYIYKVSDRILSGDRTVLYHLHFISKEAIIDVNRHVSRAYSGKVSDIAKEIISNPTSGLQSKKFTNIEPTSNSIKFISNFWTPVKSLTYIANGAASSTGSANYVFFENRAGFNFVSLDLLYKQPAKQEFVYDNYARDIQSDGRSIINLNEDYKRILDIDVPVVQDYIERARSGMFASKLISHDILTKRYNSKNFDIDNDYAKTSHLNENGVVTKNNIRHPNSKIVNMSKHYGAFNKFTDVSNSKTIQRRISQLAQAETTKINIVVLGRTDYTVGMKVKVNLNKVEPITSEELDTSDKILSGYYIISAINHYINRDKHECNMELIKDSFVMNLSEGK
jgi:hypothetical protein